MDKRTILFIVVAAAIMLAGTVLSNVLAPPSNTAVTQETVTTTGTAGQESSPSSPVVVSPEGLATIVDATRPADTFIALDDPLAKSETYHFKNKTFDISFDSKGARISSIKLLEHQDGNSPVEMLFPSDEGGLQTRFGGLSGQLMLEDFIRKPGSADNVVEFYRDYQRNDAPGKIIRVVKKYTFIPNDYLIQLDIGFEYSVNDFLPAGKDGFAYTVSIGPQIGPTSSKIATGQDIRRLVYHTGTKTEKPGVGLNTEYLVKENVRWIAIDGKYFSFISIPGAAEQEIKYTTKERAPGQPGSQLHFSRKTIQASRNIDTFRFYVGPKLTKYLSKYDKTDDNMAKLSEMKFQELADWDPLGWLAEAMKWVMGIFYLLIPNWGVAIILLTILVKVALFPLSKKSAESMARMQELNPQITKLREKYAEDPQRMNQEMAALYQKEKINPLGGCLPMLLQFPFFFAMYGLFNNHFDLRGAMFISGWITDLSQPESIYYFGQLPILSMINMTDIRLLPILYVLSQIISTKFTPTSAGGQSNAQMKLMMYGLPLIFFFMLYNVPSGLLVYWIFQNILTIFQQVIVNGMMAKKKTAK